MELSNYALRSVTVHASNSSTESDKKFKLDRNILYIM